MENKNIDWQHVIFGDNGQYIKFIDQCAERRFNQGVLAEEAAAYVLESLSANNWEVCEKYQGRSSIKTYLTIVIKNLLEEFSRKRYGKKVPPVWLKREGDLWVRLWKQLCLERQAIPSLVHRYCVNQEYQQSWVENIIRTIKARLPNCGKPSLDAYTVDNISDLSDRINTEGICMEYGVGQGSVNHEKNTDGFNIESHTRANFFLFISIFFDNKTAKSAFSSYTDILSVSMQYDEILQKMKETLHFSDQEKLILKMRYQSGLSRSATARMLNLAPYKVSIIEKQVLTRFGEVCTKYDLDLDGLLNEL